MLQLQIKEPVLSKSGFVDKDYVLSPQVISNPPTVQQQLPLTVKQAVACLQVADDADGGDGEHAAQAEDVAAEAVVNARDVASQPRVAEGGQDGERVEADAAEEVDHGQVDAEQLRAHHLLPPAVTNHQNQPISQDREQN